MKSRYHRLKNSQLDTYKITLKEDDVKMNNKVRMIMEKSEGTPLTQEQIRDTISRFCDNMQTLIDTRFKSTNIDISKELQELKDSINEIQSKVGGKA